MERQVLDVCVCICHYRCTEGQCSALHMPSARSATSHTDISLHSVTMSNQQEEPNPIQTQRLYRCAPVHLIFGLQKVDFIYSLMSELTILFWQYVLSTS